MRYLPESIIEISSFGISDDTAIRTIDTVKITEYDILESILSKIEKEDIKDVKVDISGDEGLVILTTDKISLIEFLKKAEKQRKQAEYDKKLLSYRDRIGDIAVKYLFHTPIDPEKIIEFIPSKELIEEDFKLYWRCYTAGCGYSKPDEGLLSLELAKKMATREGIDEYPEILQYHYILYPQATKTVTDASFTKTEFLESIRQKKKLKN